MYTRTLRLHASDAARGARVRPPLATTVARAALGSGIASHRPMDPIRILVKAHGPYVIALEDASRVRIEAADGTELVPEPGKRIALCRCGGSASKPFCDGTHKRIGFLRDVPTAPPLADPGTTP